MTKSNDIAQGNRPGSTAAGESRVAFLAAAFRKILKVVFLMFVFAVLEMVALWQVCNHGMQGARLLEHQGLPTLSALASLQQQLALYRLNSYEYLFAQEGEKARKAKNVEALAVQMRTELKNLQLLLPQGEGRQLAANLATAIETLDVGFQKVRSLVDTDFPGAMKSMDEEIPPQIARLDAAAEALKEYGYRFSGGQASATFDSFGWIKKNAVFFGLGNILVALGVVTFVQIAARRTRAQLSETLAQLDERSAELSHERDLLRTLLDNSPDPIYFKDAESRFLKVSKSTAELLGLPAETAMVGKTDFDFFGEENARAGFNCEQEIIRTGKPWIGQTEKQTFTDGRTTWHLTSKLPFRNPAGEIIGTFGISKDITERKQSEERLEQSQHMLQSTLDALSAHIAILDAEAVIIAVNAVWRKFAEANEFMNRQFGVGLNYLKVCESATGNCSKEARAVAAGIRDVLDNKQSGFQLEYPCHSPTEQRWFEVRVTSFGSGDSLRIVVAHENITRRKLADEKLAKLHNQLLETSRQAGMAEVATSVLHNVGNVLNTVNVSAALVTETTRKSKIPYVGKVATLLHKNAANLGAYLTTDPRGLQLPGYLSQLAEQLAGEQENTVKELELLRQNIEHINRIVAMQQSYAKISGVSETVAVSELVEDALRMNAGALERHVVELVREYAEVAPITVEKHKVLQILVNLIRNAKHACDDSGRTDKQIKLRISQRDALIEIAVVDNGVGVPPENLDRIFNHGFTTRKNGHGFGLHSGATAAKELGGSLNVQSSGPGTGATFILTLPAEPKKNGA